MDTIEKFGKPDLKIAGLLLWIHGRQFEDSLDYWDGNWVRVTAHCGAIDTSVNVTGSFLNLPEISTLENELNKLTLNLKGKFDWFLVEPYLGVTFEFDNLGHIEVNIKITPDNLTQEHSYIFEIDQSYLPSIISQCKGILLKYPIRE